MASVLVFCVQCALMSICLDPTHLVTCLLINFPQLLSLITLLICSLYNLRMFAVPCWFIVVYCVPCVLSSLFQLCPALPASQSLFPLRGCFLFVLFIIINKKPVSSCNWVLALFPSTQPDNIFRSVVLKVWYAYH